MALREQLLTKLLKGLEGSSTGINLSAVLLERWTGKKGKRHGWGKLDTTFIEKNKEKKKGNVSTWCLSRRASAPVTSLASSSEDTSPRMPLIQDIRSLCTDEKLDPDDTIYFECSSSPAHRLYSKSIQCTFSPEVREEALQVMRVSKLVFALVSTSYQTAPGSVELSTLLLYVIHSLRVGLD